MDKELPVSQQGGAVAHGVGESKAQGVQGHFEAVT